MKEAFKRFLKSTIDMTSSESIFSTGLISLDCYLIVIVLFARLTRSRLLSIELDQFFLLLMDLFT
jgi:hypothetical protein